MSVKPSNTSLVLTFFVIIFLFVYFLNKRRHVRMPILNYPDDEYQVVVVVNKDLDMSKGKILSQFGHAIDALHEKFKDSPGIVKAWRNSGSAKIAVKGSQDDINRVYDEAKKAKILYVRIYDAGRTQVKPGSNTVIVVGPATKKELKNITGMLKLY